MSKTNPDISSKQHDLDIVIRKADELKEYDRNPRVHSKEQITKLIRLIEKYGFYNPIIINSANTVLCGNGRLTALREMGRTHVETRTVRGLTVEEEKALVIADNRSAEDAGWSDEFLAFHLKDLQTLGFPLEFTGFEIHQINEILKLGEEDEAGKGTTAESPPTREKMEVELEDLMSQAYLKGQAYYEKDKHGVRSNEQKDWVANSEKSFKEAKRSFLKRWKVEQ